MKKQEFRAEEAHSIGAEGQRLLRIGESSDVRFDGNAVPIHSGGRLVCLCVLGLPFAREFLLPPTNPGDLRRRGIDAKGALCPVEDGWRAVRQIEHPRIGAHHERKIECARQDRHVRRRSAQGGAQAEHA